MGANLEIALPRATDRTLDAAECRTDQSERPSGFDGNNQQRCVGWAR
jgi:hypothetical protein